MSILPVGSEYYTYSAPSQDEQIQLEMIKTPFETVVYFQYSQRRYWEGVHLLSQVKKQALPIAIALYPGYQYLFLFDNVTSHVIYSKDALRVQKMNKSLGGQQLFLKDRWFEKNNQRHLQSINYFSQTSLSGENVKIQKKYKKSLRSKICG